MKKKTPIDIANPRCLQPHNNSMELFEKQRKKARAELGQAHLTLELGFTLTMLITMRSQPNHIEVLLL